ncbi:MAG: PQQ-binding-like beta-propeller repeat protein [Deltaproteobacteria bacterium]|nr:PQQ-binding-like beta-propeller repeat protein [Deltaproteobacteria bacterium]
MERVFTVGASRAAGLGIVVALATALIAGTGGRALAETPAAASSAAASAEIFDGSDASDSPYSPGGWSTLHQGPDNRKLVRSAPIAGPYRTWTALAGASILTAPTLSPDGQTLYVTTGRSIGHANLHAFSIDGQPLWQSEPWQDAERGVDPCAILSSPIVDREGDVYVGDCNQLYAYHASGELKWVVSLPARRDGDWRPSKKLPINAFTTAVFTREGDILGVTNFGDVAVYDRATGRLINEPKRLPGLLPPPTALKLARSAFGRGLIDPEIREWAWQLLMGGRMRSTNTPAVDLETGRVFVAATSRTRGKGALYALDVIHHRTVAGTGEWSDGESSDFEGPEVELRLAFSAEMGPGSGSSPALSIERHRVYVSDERGILYSVDTKTGQDRGSIQTKAASAAAAVATNGDMIVLQSGPPALAAVTRKGALRRQSDLPALPRPGLPKSRMLGEPVAMGNGNPTVVGERGPRAGRVRLPDRLPQAARPGARSLLSRRHRRRDGQGTPQRRRARRRLDRHHGGPCPTARSSAASARASPPPSRRSRGSRACCCPASSSRSLRWVASRSAVPRPSPRPRRDPNAQRPSRRARGVCQHGRSVNARA